MIRTPNDKHELKILTHRRMVNHGVPRGLSWQKAVRWVDNGLSSKDIDDLIRATIRNHELGLDRCHGEPKEKNRLARKHSHG